MNIKLLGVSVMNLDDVLVKDDKSYPEIEGAINSPKTVAVLKNLMAGNMGELTAVLQYFYQSSIARVVDEKIGEILEEISIVEMSHIELLSHAIVDFGGEPRYENSKGQYYSANSIFYSSKLREMLDANILAEEKAIEEYKVAIKEVENPSLKNLFARIIDDEQLHLKIFTYLRNNVKFLAY